MKKILVPCDFSKPAIGAFRFALEIARKSKGVVHLINVIELPAIHDPIIMPVVSLGKDFIKELKQNVGNQFEKLALRYNTKGVALKTDIAYGSPARLIADVAKKRSVDLVIMGSHGTSGIREYFVGSNAEKVVRMSPVPVMVTKSFPKGVVKNIVFPNTLETESQQDLIRRVKALQAFFKATVHILYVNTPTNFTADNITMDRLDRFAKTFMFRNYTLNVYNYPFEEAGIIHFTRSIKGDLITMGTHGRTGISHFLNGSLTEDVVNHTDCPIWTYANR